VRVVGGDADIRIGGEGRAASLLASYSYTRSRRDWGNGWVPWINERPHQVRVAATIRPPLGTIFAVTGEASSGYRYTEYVGFYPTPGPSEHGPLGPITGPENAAQGPMAVRIDASLTRPFRGLFGLEFEIGLSIVNASFGETTPREARFSEANIHAPAARIYSEQIVPFPALPTLIFRVRPKPQK
jgi:hypothetical protein